VPSKASVLTSALLNASKEMGISTTHLGKVIDKDSSEIKHTDINPEGKSGELALMLIRCYTSLHALVGNNKKHMQHWMHTHNSGTQGIPVEQLLRIDGLVRVTEYLDTISRKV
jgi:Antitoxin Xre/MbcA/ParS C-terminal toxin-binding domain